MRIIIGLLLISCSFYAAACDICGSAASGNQLGILPQFQKHFIGISYLQSAYHSKPHDGIVDNKSETTERFQTLQFWGRASIHKKVQVFAFIPYKYNVRSMNTGVSKLSGLGDMMILANMFVFNTTNQTKQKVKHALQLGTGLKIPTGKSDVVQNGLMLHTNMQTGTGSYDIPFNLMYTLRYQSFGFNTELNFTKNGTNKQHFQFGNRTIASMRFFAWKNWKKLTWLPSIGTTFEHAAMDQQQEILQDFTGGNSVLGNGGIDLYYQSFGLQLLFQQSVYQHLGNGYINNRPRWAATFIYLF
ncbi:MAG: hypothetical protein IPN14_14955 [Bacteroidetes bacterium]|nr:hypothetical protein [Bacteroidota bacterium]